MKITNITLWDDTKKIDYYFPKDSRYGWVFVNDEGFEKFFFDGKEKINFIFHLLNEFKERGYKLTEHRNYKINDKYYINYHFSL